MTTNSSEIYEQADNLIIGQKKGKFAPIIYKQWNGDMDFECHQSAAV